MELTATIDAKKDVKRIASVDYLRGIVMVIMALDHVRDYFHVTAQTADPVDLSTTTPMLFFTRWITHFCAPVFVFLSGVSAYLSSRNKPLQQTSSFLIKRGIWLAVVDFTLMTFIMSFNPRFNFIFLTTLWAIGCSMILLGIVLKLSPRLVLPIGVLLFLGHDLAATYIPQQGAVGSILKVLLTGRYVAPIDPGHFIGFLYGILPWTSVMFLGYAFGRNITDRRKVVIAGLTLLVLFIVLRIINVYGDPSLWQKQVKPGYTLLSFLNTTKYPASLQFLCMTLGPALLLLAAIWRIKSAVLNFVSVYGRVPFFYFVMHFLLAHILLVIAFFLSGYGTAQIIDPAVPFWFRPQHFGFSLPAVYGVWILVVLLMYYPCRYFDRYKQRHKRWWLRYL